MVVISWQDANGSPLIDIQAENWKSVLDLGLRSDYPAGTVIYHADQIPNAIFYLHRGLVKQYILTENGGQKIIGLIKPANLIGEALYFHQSPSQCTAVTAENSIIYSFKRNTLDRLFQTHPRLLLDIARSLSFKARMQTTQIGIMAVGNAEIKVGKVLYLLTQCSGEKNSVVRLTHQALADLAGVHRVTVSNVLAKLKKEGVIEFRRGCIELKKSECLFKYRYI